MINNDRRQSSRKEGRQTRTRAKKGMFATSLIVLALLFVTFAVVQYNDENDGAGAMIGLSTADLHSETVLFTADGDGVNEVTGTFDLQPGKIYKFEVWGGGCGIYVKGGYSIGWYDTTHNASTLTAYYHVGGQGTIGIAGGTGGANGGADGGGLSNTTFTYYGSGGGGASDIRIGGDKITPEDNRVIVAGGAGGPGYANGGAGGGLNGDIGYAGNSSVSPGSGGKQTAGGAGGNGSPPGSSGSLGAGGAGASGTNAGGGGGGYYGGGGGSNRGIGTSGGGGGGGSGYIGGVGSLSDSNASTISNTKTGEGQVKVTEYGVYGVIGKVTDVNGNPLNGVTISYTIKGVPGTTTAGSNGVYVILQSKSLLPADVEINGVTLTNYFLDTDTTPLPSSSFAIDDTTPFHSGVDFRMLQRYLVYDDVAGILIGSKYWLEDAVALCSVSSNRYTIVATENDTDMTNGVSVAITIPVSAEITLTSDASSQYTISMEGYARHFIINGGSLTLDKINLSGKSDIGGFTRGGVSVCNTGSLTLNNAAIQNCYYASDGGGVDLVNSSKLIVNSGAISDNRAGGNCGGVFSDSSFIVMYGGFISNNISGGTGGSDVWNGSAGEIEISGGTVQGTGGNTAITNNNSTGSVTVSGAATVTSDGSTAINNSGVLNISGGTVSNSMYAVSSTGQIALSNAPSVTGTISALAGGIEVDGSFGPGLTDTYDIEIMPPAADGDVAVTNGTGFIDNFVLKNTGFLLEDDGSDLILRTSYTITLTIDGDGSVDVTAGSNTDNYSGAGPHTIEVISGYIASFSPINGSGTFSHWSDGTSTSTDDPYDAAITGAYDITAYFYDGTGDMGDGSYVITAIVDGNGTVDVTFDDQDGNSVTLLDVSGSVIVYGTDVTFEANNGTGTFSHWFDSAVVFDSPYVVSFTDPYEITAYFYEGDGSDGSYTIIVNVDGDGTVDVTFEDQDGNSVILFDISGPVIVYGMNVTFEATQGATSTFSHWFDSVAEADNPYGATVDVGYTITAYFYEGNGSDGSYTIIVTVDGGGTVDVTFEDQDGHTFTFAEVSGPVIVYRTDLTFEANNGTGIFSHWFDSAVVFDSPYVVGFTDPYEITAYFYEGDGSDGSCTITVTINGDGNVDVTFEDRDGNSVILSDVSGPAIVYGTDVTFMANNGTETLSHWSDGTSTITDNPYDAIVSMGYSITAMFSSSAPHAKYYYITATSDGKTSISPEGTITVAGGASKTFYFSADAGYYIGSVTVDGKNLSQAEIDLGYYMFSNVNLNHTIKVQTYTEKETEMVLSIVVVEGSGYAEYCVNGGSYHRYNAVVPIPEHADISVRAFADEGYVFSGWGDGSEIYRSSDYARQGLMTSLYLELHFTNPLEQRQGNLDDGSGSLWWTAVLLLIVAGILIWFLFFYWRTYDVIKITNSASIIGKDRVRRKAAYIFTVEGTQPGTASYRVGEDGQWKTIFINADGEYAIPRGEITDYVTIEYR